MDKEQTVIGRLKTALEMHNHTTADAPETVRFIREEFRRLELKGIKCIINYPVYEGKRTSKNGNAGGKCVETGTWEPPANFRFCKGYLKKFYLGKSYGKIFLRNL